MCMSVSSEDMDSGARGLFCLVHLLRFHGIPADINQLRHAHAIGDKIESADIVRIARRAGMKSRVVRPRGERLEALPMPAIVGLKDGGFLLLGKAAADKVLVLEPGNDRPTLWTREAFDNRWNGSVILATKRAPLSDLGRRFDLSWFIGAMHKYRRLLGEVLIASFFLQIFALITPLFFQVVIDKVLVHRGLSTLDVIVIGLITVAVFETVLGALRTYVFAHTTNRIDVELGARVFRHLLALPMAYFQTRRVGDSVARVRELETIRTFLTSSALTLVVDLVFTFVFIIVMFSYSPWLSGLVMLSFPLYAAISIWA